MASGGNIKKAAGLYYAIIFFNIAATIFYTPWMISKIGVDNYGLYILVTSFLAYFTTDYGLWQAVNKLLAQHRTSGNVAMERKVMESAVTLYLIFDVVIAVALIIVFLNIGNFYTSLDHDQLRLFRIIYIIAALFAVLSFPFTVMSSVFMSREYFTQLRVFELFKKVGVIVVTVTLLFLDFGVVALVIAFGLVPLLTRSGEYVYLLKKGVKVLPGRLDRSIAKDIISLSFWLLLIVLGELFVTNISPSIIARYNDTTQIAIFAIGLSIYSYLSTFAGALNGLFLPKVYRLRNEGDPSKYQRLSITASAVQLFIMGLLVTGIIALGREFIYYWLGDGFNDSYPIAVLLALPTLIYFCQPIEETELFAADKLKYRSYMMVATAVSSVALSVVLCPVYKAIGAAIAIAVSKFIFLNIGMNIIYARILKRPRKRFFILFSRFVAAYAIVYLLFRVALHFIDLGSGWIHFFINVILYTVIYIIVGLLIALPSDARDVMVTPVLKKLRIHSL